MEGVSLEWTADPKHTDQWEFQTMRLKKDPQKVCLFQDICDLVRPVTNFYGDRPRLTSHLQSISSWESLEVLCAQYIQQDPRKPQYVPPGASDQVANPQTLPQDQDQPSTPSVPQVPIVSAQCLDGLAAPGTPPVQEGVLTGSRAHNVATEAAAVLQLP